MQLLELLKSVEDFQKAFGAGCQEMPTNVHHKVSALRFKLMAEENFEYLDACETDDLIGIADSLGDMLYVLCGTILEHGMQDIIEKVFTEIHRSNMSKLDHRGKPIINGENGVLDETRPLGKVLKSEQYRPPVLKYIVSSGIMNAKSKITNKIFKEIQQLEFLMKTASNEKLKDHYLKEIEKLNEELEANSITKADVQF